MAVLVIGRRPMDQPNCSRRLFSQDHDSHNGKRIHRLPIANQLGG